MDLKLDFNKENEDFVNANKDRMNKIIPIISMKAVHSFISDPIIAKHINKIAYPLIESNLRRQLEIAVKNQ